MGLFQRRSAEPTDGRHIDMLVELERLVRRAAKLPLAAPLLLLCGLALGKVTARSLRLPEGAPVRSTPAGPAARIPFDTLGDTFRDLRTDGERTEEYVVLYQNHVAPVEESLRRRGVPAEVARKVAWPLIEHAYRRDIDPATVVAVLIIESRGQPRATSSVGARGLMQVMPAWVGRWRECGRDLYDIEDNLCNGTSILAWNLRRYRGDERRALLSYNGCIRGTNTPDCHRYPDKVLRIRGQIAKEWQATRRAPPVAASP